MPYVVFVIACTSRKVDIHVGSSVDKHENKKLTMKELQS
jgi:hypothetical protein